MTENANEKPSDVADSAGTCCSATSRDTTFEAGIFAWYQQRTRELLSDPNDEEFQVRYDEHSKVFDAILMMKNAMLSPERQRQVARMLVDSLSGS